MAMTYDRDNAVHGAATRFNWAFDTAVVAGTTWVVVMFVFPVLLAVGLFAAFLMFWFAATMYGFGNMIGGPVGGVIGLLIAIGIELYGVIWLAKRWERRQAQKKRPSPRTTQWVEWHQGWRRKIMEHFVQLDDWLKDNPGREQEVIEIKRRSMRKWADAASLQSVGNPQLAEYAATCMKASEF
jgi:hypothetical protein